MYFKLCKQTRRKMCNFEGYLICFELANIFQSLALYFKMCVMNLMIFNHVDF